MVSSREPYIYKLYSVVGGGCRKEFAVQIIEQIRKSGKAGITGIADFADELELAELQEGPEVEDFCDTSAEVEEAPHVGWLWSVMSFDGDC